MKKANKVSMFTMALTLTVVSFFYMGKVPVWAGQAAQESLDSQAETKTGSCGDKVSWSIDTETGVMVISGTGKTTDLLYSPPSYWDYVSKVRKVIISEGVTGIGDKCFQGFSNMTDIEIPESVESIGDYSFSGCAMMKEIKLPSGLKSIGVGAFQACYGLEKIEIPAGVTQIKEGTFAECKSLTHMTIPEGVASIGEGAFFACVSLTDVEILNKDCVIAEHVFVINDGESGEEELPVFKPIPGMKIHAPKGSKAETYAATCGITFVATSGPHDMTPTPTPGPVVDPPKDPQAGEPQMTDANGNTFKNKAGEPEDAGSILQDDALRYEVSNAKTGLAELTVKESIDENASAVTIPDEITLNEVTYKVTGFGARAFKKNKKIKKIVIGANVTSIPKNAFKGLKSLRSIVIKTKKLKIKTVAKGAFKGLGKRVVIKTPKGKKKAYESLFRKKGLSKKVKVK